MNHDQLFKLLLTTFFLEFVKLFLPDVARHIDPDSIEFLDKEIFTDLTSRERHEVDLIVKVRFRRGGRAFFLIHVENQGSSKKDFAKRMFRYFARLHEKYDLPIYPVAIFSFDRPLRPEPNRYQVNFPNFRPLDFAFHAIQLNWLNWRDFLRKPNPVASALMTKMHIDPGDRPRVKLECLRMLATLRLDKARAALIGVFMSNYLELTSAETAVYNEMLESVGPKEREIVMQLTNEWIEKGREEGLQQGLQRGREQGQRDLVLRLLRRQIGTIPAKMTRQVDRLNDADMMALSDALFDFTRPADAQRWLAQHAK
jgi:predicted transposase YdaD